MSTTVATSTVARSYPRAHHHSRAKSLRLTALPKDIPIPPSLLKSPHLYSPQSVFRRTASTPRIPSDEDEVWLRDTVPLGAADRRESGLQPAADEERRGRAQIRGTSNAPPSPPLVHWRQPCMQRCSSAPNIACMAGSISYFTKPVC